MSKKVAIFTENFDSSNTSAGQHMTDLVEELSKNSTLSIDVYTFVDSGENEDKILSKNVNVHRIKNGKKRDSSFVRRAIDELLISFKVFNYIRKLKKIKSFENILWYSPTIFWGPLVMYFKLINKTKNILILRDIFPKWTVDLEIIKKYSIQYYFFRAFELLQYRAADIIAIQTEGNREFLGNYNKVNSKIMVLRTWFHPINDVKKIGDDLYSKIPFTKKKICVYAGNLGVAQNQELLLKAFEQVGNNNDDYHFVLIGLKPSDQNAAIVQAKKMNLTNLTFIEPITIDALNSVLKKAFVGIFALDSRHTTHNIPGKFLHYIGIGIPVFGLTNKNNDLNTIIKDNNLGSTYSGKNPIEAAEIFMQLANKIENKEYTGELIQKYVIEKLSPNKTSAIIERALD